MTPLFTRPFDLHEKLKSLTCKTLIVHGDKDPISLPVIERTHKSIPNSRLVILKDCGHFPYVEKPDELFPILDAFLHDKSYTARC
ncbi:MAG: alpha/beta hydrolase [Chlamydiae bacterium]|nr:alpha/beta hydrolase [Chlamydiota bacterium]